MDNDEWLQEFVDSASEIDEEDLRDMDAENQVIDQTIEPESTTQPQPVDTTSKEVEPEQEEGNALKTGAEVALAIPTGTVDWGIGLVNTIIPGERLDIPNIPRFENDVTQSIKYGDTARAASTAKSVGASDLKISLNTPKNKQTGGINNA